MDWAPVILLIVKASVIGTAMFFAVKWHYDQDRKDEGTDAQWTSELRIFITMLVALTLSLIGIVYAGCWGDRAVGGTGGALAFVLTLAVFLVAKPTAEADLYDRLGQAGHALDEEGIQHIEALRDALIRRRDSLLREKIYFSIAVTISALAWAYGNVAAGWFSFVR
ncbi:MULTISPECIES: hypothetical protein [unclassified Novosphingobium]|uniref:hypothetical protein n=1 Tax=unclassified Novosphingobium TaxID=2644732 RepID=UPI000A58C107|nr:MULTISPECIES: hypothetical protein [unclassified Novosphingobium]MDR6708653.1 hypothetical protein [Novosphingobium sp. 1748]